MEKKILVTKSSMPSLEEYVDEIRDLWDSCWLTNEGAKLQKLEQSLGEYLEVPYVSCVSNGHMALELGLQAMRLEGEVITTPFTVASTTNAILRNGLQPVFCDIKPDDFTMDETMLESLITDRTCAILPVHVYGNVCNVTEIDRIAKKHGLKVIYDAAHAFGVRYLGKSIAQYGDAVMYSFHATKVYQAVEGGAVCYRHPETLHYLNALKIYGIQNPEEVVGVGANGKMNEFEAAMGLCNLRHIAQEIEKRKRIAQYYDEQLGNIPGLQINVRQAQTQGNYAYYPLVVHETECGFTRNELLDRLAAHQIFGRKYFYPLTSSFQCYHQAFQPERTPTALHISRRVLALPLYASLSMEDASRICTIIRSMCGLTAERGE